MRNSTAPVSTGSCRAPILLAAMLITTAARAQTPTPTPADAAQIQSESLSGFRYYNVPETLGFSVTYHNTGESTWSAGAGYGLSIEGAPVLVQAIPEGIAIPPGFSHEFHGVIIPPATPCDFMNLLCTYPCTVQMTGPGGPFGQQIQATTYVGGYPPQPTPTPTPSPTPLPAGREVGDFDGSGCTDLSDFLFLLDHWMTEIDGVIVGLDDFLNLLDNWQQGPACP